ncbi:hypothetical protein CHS0354_009523 [Potamilus streckersoni]|uniref:Uncharacterized protein n=1 Tax=Potamilus streckersoni TaxID=2493646 RepID=A0AAE0SNW6_9BIVA|nr:hypothetical protein CHS0354_009523 [Potamilus streckersoni]
MTCTGLFLIENAANNFKDIPSTKDVLENLGVLRKMFLTSIKNRMKTFESVQEQKQEIINEIESWTIAMKDIIAKLQIAALEEMDQVCKQETVVISDQIVECKSVIAAINLSERMLMEGTKLGDETKMFITNRRVSQQVNNYVFKYEATVNKFNDIRIEFQRDNNLDGLVHNLSSLGKVLSKASKLHVLYSENSFERAMMLMPRAQIEMMVNFIAKVPDDETTCIIISVSYMKMTDEPRHMCSVDKQIVAVTRSGRSVEAASVTNTLTKVRNIYVGRERYGIASYQQNIFVHTYVNEQNSLLIYDKSYKRIQNYNLLYPTSCMANAFSASADGQSIYYKAGDKIVNMDIDGKTLNTFESNDLKEPLGITIDTNGIVYYCGHQSQTVI